MPPCARARQRPGGSKRRARQEKRPLRRAAENGQFIRSPHTKKWVLQIYFNRIECEPSGNATSVDMPWRAVFRRSKQNLCRKCSL